MRSLVLPGTRLHRPQLQLEPAFHQSAGGRRASRAHTDGRWNDSRMAPPAPRQPAYPMMNRDANRETAPTPRGRRAAIGREATESRRYVTPHIEIALVTPLTAQREPK